MGVSKQRFINRPGQVAWIALMVLLGLCLIGGGSNLPSVPGLILLRPVSILLIAILVLVRAPDDAGSMRAPVIFLTGLTISIFIQLIPLPPFVWSSLPGRAYLADLPPLIGAAMIWRPLSLTPGITLSSLLATLTCWAVVVAFARMPRQRDRGLAGVVILMAAVSCVVALLQVLGGKNGFFFLYRGDGSISGLLANRNHQATMLAMALPLLRLWAVGGDASGRLRRNGMASLMGALLIGTIFLTGSRSGLLAALIGIVGAFVIAPEGRGRSPAGRWAIAARWGVIVVPVMLVALVIIAGRDLSVQRLFNADYADEVRFRSLPTVWALVTTYFPFGSGYGSFDAVFRMYEPDALLEPTYLNRAHNDYLELAITGGLFPIIVLVAAVGWASWRGWLAFRHSWRDRGILEARAGAVVLLILAVSSLSDYPVRTPLIAAIASIAFCWVARARFGVPSGGELPAAR